MHTSNFLFLLLAGLCSLAWTDADVSSSAAKNDALIGEWKLVSYGSDDGVELVPEDLQYMGINFTEGHLSFRSSCNSGNGNYKADPRGTVKFDKLFTTLVGCPSDEYNKWEVRMKEVLAAATHYNFFDGQLYIWNDVKERLVLEPR